MSQSSSGGPPPRDRDDAGRPRSSRPRDDLGRPLPPGTAREAARPDSPPGAGLGAGSVAGSVAGPGASSVAGPVAGSVAGPVAGSVAGPAEAASAGGTLLLEGRPFHAHEVFEEAWKGASGPERDLWRGLAQVAVGLTHARRGNPRGAVSLLRRGAERLRDYSAATQAPSSYGIDVPHVASGADALAAQIEHDGLDGLPPEAFLLSLRPAP